MSHRRVTAAFSPLPRRPLAAPILVAALWLGACTVVTEPADTAVADDVAVIDIPAPDLSAPEDLGPETTDTAPLEDTPIGPTDVIIIGPTDVFISNDTADGATADATPTDVTTPTDTGPVLPPVDIPRMTRYRLVWEDDFNGPPCDPNTPASCPDDAIRDRVARCFGSSRNPVETTLLNNFHPDPTQPTHFRRATIPHLASLDKCAWAVSDHVNSRHFVGPGGPIMSYRPESVRVEHGELRLTTRRAANWSSATNDCGRKLNANGPNSEENLSRNCEYDGANVVSQPFNGLDAAHDATGRASGNGRTFPPNGATEGRLEVRARIPRTQGNVPIMSTWASDPSRFEPEYTLMSHFITEPRTTSQAVATYTGQGTGVARARHTWNEPQVDANDEFHVFGASWKAGAFVRFDMNLRELGFIADGAKLNTGSQCVDLRVTGHPVHLMLRNIMSAYTGAPGAGPTGALQPHDTLAIDWVRWWEPCADDDPDPACVESTLSPSCKDPCEGFGRYEGPGCYLGQTPTGTTAEATERYVGYRRGTGINPCTRGGMSLDGICAVIAVPQGRTGFVRDNRWYATSACSPTHGLANCGAPCPLEGTYWVPEKYACFYRARIPNTNSFVYDNNLYYAAVSDHPSGPCPFGGNFDGSNCHIGRPPSGFIAVTYDGDYYLEPNVCPEGGTWDRERKACMIRDFPAGNTPFIYGNNIYYATPTPNQCPHGGTYDGANCNWRPIPIRMKAFVEGNRAYFRAACYYSTDWGILPNHPATSALEGTPCP